MNQYNVTILGAGLAGCEAALWLAGKGVQVDLYEQKPVHFSPAHKSEGFAELICSNSLKAERLDSASGLLKEEMRRMGSQLLEAAEVARVAAGGALAVDQALPLQFCQSPMHGVGVHPGLGGQVPDRGQPRPRPQQTAHDALLNLRDELGVNGGIFPKFPRHSSASSPFIF